MRGFPLALAALLLVACQPARLEIAPGISWDLAQHRQREISDVRYALRFSIPVPLDERVRGHIEVQLRLRDTQTPLVLDFRAPPEDVLAVRLGGREVAHEVRDEHIVVPESALQTGPISVEIDFLAGDLSLNRNPEYLYTLFVPDRASTAFPVFDQPDLKASFALTLETPASWKAVANGPLLESETAEGRTTHTFGETQPISSYLFAFAAGELEVESAEHDGRLLHLYHRETDTEKVARNRDAVFELHAAALRWLEDYTGIPYPFEKLELVLIPSTQYSGMEHPCAILYRASRLFLDESATQEEELGRASLIAHETAHMWFGDLVTMRWFDDVWTKEVFANFMAAKIVNPSFPDIDHDLRFFLSHYPAAYGIDRTQGANPIRQKLDNLNQAGALYGAIIYNKAPIVMRQLEMLTGEQAFREGIREYLGNHAFGNATWPDLIAILDRRCEEDLATWSSVWVDKPQRPTIETELSLDAAGAIQSLRLTQHDPAGKGRIWSQTLHVTLASEDGTRNIPVYLNADSVEVTQARGLPAPPVVLAAGDGLGYGLFRLDPASRDHLLESLESLPDARTRGAAWVSLWDALLEGDVAPRRLVETIVRALPHESSELTIQRVLSYLTTAYWRFTPVAERLSLAPTLETLLWKLLEKAQSTSLKAAYFEAFRSIVLTEGGTGRLARIWRKDEEVRDLPLAERDFTALAEELALRGVGEAETILREQLGRIENPDRRARFEFILPALSSDPATRDEFFASLRDPRNREHEPWVVAAVSFLHHPLRAETAEKHITPSLELLEEIQRTGDIFFPKRWLDATLGGHSSATAAEAVRSFLEARPDYPERLRGKILQSTDGLFRAAVLRDREEGAGQ